VSPANTYVGLTTNLPGSAPGEPQKYYPTGTAHVPEDRADRLDPGGSGPDRYEQAGCTKVAVANDKEAYGQGLADVARAAEGLLRVTITSNTGVDPTPRTSARTRRR